MIRSKNIADYFPAPVSTLRPHERLPFDACLYLKRNNHIVLWKAVKQYPTPTEIAELNNRGIHRIWIHQEDKNTYLKYLYDKVFVELDTNAPKDKPVQAAKPMEDLRDPRDDTKKTPEGALVAAALDAKNLTRSEKRAVASELARGVFDELLAESEPNKKVDAMQKARAFVKDVLDSKKSPCDDAINELWDLGNLDLKITHSVNVATYAVIFALAFERIDRGGLSQIALAALIHDIGIALIPADIGGTPWMHLDPKSYQVFNDHVELGVHFSKPYLPLDHGEAITAMNANHHERFDGTGFPYGHQGFDLSDVDQIISLADWVESKCSGLIDGKSHSLEQAFDQLEEWNSNPNFPQYFNPEVISTILNWMKIHSMDHSVMDQATHVIKEQSEKILKPRE